MMRWLAALRRDRAELIEQALERLAESGSSLAAHEAEYLVKACINAYCVAVPQGRRGQFAETMAAIAEREARAGNALRAEAVVVALQLLAERAIQLPDEDLDPGDTAPAALVEAGRNSFLSTYLRAKAEEDDRRALALESYAEAVEDVPAIIYSTDEEGRITDISHQAAEQLGYRKEDLLGRHHSVLMRPEDAERFSHFIQERRTQERATRRARLLLRAADGCEREFEVSSTGVYDEQGRYIGSDGIARAVSDSIIQLSYQLDPDGRFQEISEAAAAVLGYTKEELLGQHFSALMDVRERDRIGRMFGERRADDRAANRIRVNLSSRDGVTREFEISAVGQYDSEGRFIGTMGLGSDLSGRTELERGVVEQRRKYRRIFDQSGFGLSLISADLVVRDVNAWHLRRRRRKLDGAPCHLALFGETGRCPWCGLNEALHQDREIAREDILSPLDGRRYNIWFSPLRDDDGRLLGVIEAVLDVTDLRQARQTEQDQQRHAMVTRLVDGTRRLLAEPLTVLALTDGAVAADAVARLRLLTGPDPVRRPGEAGCRLGAIVEQVLAELQPADIDVECDLLPTCPPAALAASAAREVIEALLLNAWEAARPGGSLTIELLGDPESGVTLLVADTGAGMTTAESELATVPFSSTRESHHGLGLSRCTALLTAAGGRLRLTSSPAAGTTAEIWLPAALSETAAPSGGGEPDEPVRVAIELPDAVLREALAACLAAHGHEVVGDLQSAELAIVATDHGVAVLPAGADPAVAVTLLPPFLPADLLAAMAEALH